MTITMPEIDREALQAQIDGLHRLALPYRGKGQLVVASYGENPDELDAGTGKPGRPLTPLVRRFEIGDVTGMVAWIEQLTVQAWRNVYVPYCVVRSDLKPTAKGSEKDIIAVLAAVIDFDDAEASRWAERLPRIAPDYVLETSHQHFQVFYFFDESVSVPDAKAIGRRLRDYTHTDHGSLDTSHVWRLSGTLNWPNSRKLARGRSRAPQLVKVVSAWEANSRTTLAALDQVLPPLQGMPGNKDLENGASANGANDESQTRLDRDIEQMFKMLPEKLQRRIREPAAQGTRSEKLYGVIKELGRRGFSAGQIRRMLLAYPEGPVAKFACREDLDSEIERVLGKLEDRREQRRLQHKTNEGKPVIKLVEGKLAEIIDEAEGHLVAGDKTIYQRGDFIVTPGIVTIKTAVGEEKVPGVVLVEQFGLVERFTKLINFQSFSRTREEWETRDCPDRVAATYLKARVRRWRLPPLRMLVNRPFPRADGTICEEPGYDEASSILYLAGDNFPRVPKNPDKTDALKALDYVIETLFVHYAFVPDPPDPTLPPRIVPPGAQPRLGEEPSANRSVAVSGAMTNSLSLGTADLDDPRLQCNGRGQWQIKTARRQFHTRHRACSPGLYDRRDHRGTGKAGWRPIARRGDDHPDRQCHRRARMRDFGSGFDATIGKGPHFADLGPVALSECRGDLDHREQSGAERRSAAARLALRNRSPGR